MLVLKERKEDVDLPAGEAVIVVLITNGGDIMIDAIIIEMIEEVITIEAAIDTVNHLQNQSTDTTTDTATVIKTNKARAAGMEAIKNIDVTGLDHDHLHVQDKEMIAITTIKEILVSTKEVVIHKRSTLTNA